MDLTTLLCLPARTTLFHWETSNVASNLTRLTTVCPGFLYSL